MPSPAASTIVRLVLPVIRFPVLGECCAAAVIKRFRPQWKPESPPDKSAGFKIRRAFLLMFAV